ncbi:MAG: LysR family transcriptional regulator [Deltaproteobacteria bacterium]|nr:LysR family transcriptional regulator [Deltaproteobacteria bacterium]MBW2136470.1 LysR family transcriptional regulator [Deltaproteobacteria bacterium]
MIHEMGGDFLQWLRGFFYVAKTGSVTLAASEMMRNQPTISHQIKCLEKEFGITLFDRSRGKMELTPEGKVFLEKAISIFEVIKEMKHEVSGAGLKNRGTISIVTTHAIIHYFLPRYIVPFRERYPEVRFHVEGGGLQMILERVEAAEADFGVVNLKSIPENLNYYPLFKTGLKLITRKGSQYFENSTPDIEELSRAPFLLFPRSSTITPLIEERFSKEGCLLRVVMVLNNFEDVKKYVALGVGVAILDEYTLTKEDRERFDIFSLDPYFPEREYGILLRKKKYFSPAVKEFIHDIKPGIPF